MAVSLTVLLAIIGSAFVLTARMDRQAVRNVDSLAIAEAATANVLSIIQERLASAKVGGDSFVDVNGNGTWDAGVDILIDSNANGTYEPGLNLLSNKDSYGVDRRPFDYPGNAHPWLAPIEPGLDGNGKPIWQQTSNLLSATPGAPLHANIGAPTGSPAADADGDGVVDSFFFVLPGFDSTGKIVRIAVRIIDNCGMVNVNTAWQHYAPPGATYANPARLANPLDLNSYGEFLHQVSLYRVLNRYGVNASAWSSTTSADAERKVSSILANSGAAPEVIYALSSILYQEAVIGDFGWFGRFADYANGNAFMPYGLEDELELRNRFIINTTTETLLEKAMAGSIGLATAADPTATGPSLAFRILPYGPTDTVARWHAQLTGDRSQLVSATDTSAVPRSEQRHLLTTYSGDSEIRVSAANNAGDAFLDSVALGGVGKFRKVNVNTVLQDWMNWTTSGNPALQARARLGVLRLAKAFEGAGFTLDQGFQFAANLIDFVDPDPLVGNALNPQPTVFPTGSFTDLAGTAVGPSRDIFGTEQQVVITEVFNQRNATKAWEGSAVEIYNPPYNNAINLAAGGWKLTYVPPSGTGWDVTLQEIIQPGQRLVYVNGNVSGVTTNQGAIRVTSGPGLNNLKFEDYPATGGYLVLHRAATSLLPWATAQNVAVDQVAAGDLDVLKENSDAAAASIMRGLSDPRLPLAPWGSNRNVFSPGASMLGQFKVTAATPHTSAINRAGIPIWVPNRGPISDGALTFWRVNGLYDFGRVLLVGNPGWSNIAQGTITDAIAGNAPNTIVRHETFTDDGDGYYGAGDAFPQGNDLNGNGLYDQYWINECPAGGGNHVRWLRLNFAAPSGSNTPDLAGELFNRISFFSRADNGVDNLNADGDYDPADPNLVGLRTMADSLAEVFLPGRINVNTAPEAVLAAVFPALLDPGNPLNNPVQQPGQLSSTEIEVLSAWYARAIVYLRSAPANMGGGPFTSISNLLARLDAFTNPDDNGKPVLDWAIHASDAAATLAANRPVPGDQPRALRFGVLMDCLKGRNSGGGWINPMATVTPVGTPLMAYAPSPYTNPFELLMRGDIEERDWVFTRMANLLTVRSDTFTAYLLVRVENRDSGEFTENRYMAILDRSNVLLPQWAAANGSFYLPDGLTPKDFTNQAAVDANYVDDSGEMARFGKDAGGNPVYAPARLNDPDHFDRQYVLPKIVAFQRVADPK